MKAMKRGTGAEIKPLPRLMMDMGTVLKRNHFNKGGVLCFISFR